ncbi:MAG: T9SS type A sorting domain-containing protein [Ferruginibacter sp.]
MKRFIPILILFTGLSFSSLAQSTAGNPEDESAKYIKSYPNPATTSVNLEFQRSYDKTFYLELYNFMGKKVLDLRNLSQRTNIPLTNFYRGLYFYKLCDKNGRIIENGRFQVVK